MVAIVMMVKFGKILRHCTDKQSNTPLTPVFTYLTYCSTQSVITNNKISSSFISEVNVSTFGGGRSLVVCNQILV